MYKVKYFNEISKDAIGELDKYGVKKTAEEQFDVVVCRSAKLHDAKINSAMCVARAGIGTGNVPVDRLMNELVPVFFAPGGNADSVVENTVCKIIAGAKNIMESVHYVKESKMAPQEFEGVKKNFKGKEVKGKTVLIIGLGMIGARVAKQCMNLGMKVIGKDLKIDMDFLNGVLSKHDTGRELLASIKADDGKVRVSNKIVEMKEGTMLITDNEDDAIKVSDFVTIHCGYWGKPVFDKAFFGKCKKGLVLVNNDRGELIVEKDVIEALDNKTLKNYITDFAPADLKLRTHERCFPTPHTAATTQAAQDNCGKLIVESILKFLYDGELFNPKNMPFFLLQREGETRITISSLKEVDLNKVKELLKDYKILQLEQKTFRGKCYYVICDIDEEVKDKDALKKKLESLGKIRVLDRNPEYEKRKKEKAPKQVINFYAGPSIQPKYVVKSIQGVIGEWGDTGLSLLETSHRTKICENMVSETKQLFKELLKIPDDYDIFFVQGGATLQFSLIPMNFTKKGDKYGIVRTGTWTEKAYADGQVCEKMGFGTPVLLGDEKADKYKKLPMPKDVPQDLKYFYICWNETIHGLEYSSLPKTGKVPLVIDASSNFASRPIDWKGDNIGCLYGGAQKNCGIPGLAVVIIRKDFQEYCKEAALPMYMKYSNHIAKGSMFNTPPVVSLQSINFTLKWLKEQGGIEGIEKRNIEKSQILYELMDKSDGFYTPRVSKENRSRMNITFNLKTPELEKKFLKEAGEQGFIGLAGHRTLKGARASIYNAMSVSGVKLLAEFMKNFMKENK